MLSESSMRSACHCFFPPGPAILLIVCIPLFIACQTFRLGELPHRYPPSPVYRLNAIKRVLPCRFHPLHGVFTHQVQSLRDGSPSLSCSAQCFCPGRVYEDFDDEFCLKSSEGSSEDLTPPWTAKPGRSGIRYGFEGRKGCLIRRYCPPLGAMQPPHFPSALPLVDSIALALITLSCSVLLTLLTPKSRQGPLGNLDPIRSLQHSSSRSDPNLIACQLLSRRSHTKKILCRILDHNFDTLFL